MTRDSLSSYMGVVAGAVGAFALTFLLLGLTLAIYPGWPAIGSWANKTDSPSWIQAWGAIATVLATIFVLACNMWFEARKGALLERERIAAAKKQNVLELNKLLYALTHLRGVFERLRSDLFDGSIRRRSEWAVLKIRIQGIRDYCDNLPIWHQPNPELFKRWSQLLDAAICLEAAAEARNRADCQKHLDAAIFVCTAISEIYATAEQKHAAFYYQRGLHTRGY